MANTTIFMNNLYINFQKIQLKFCFLYMIGWCHCKYMSTWSRSGWWSSFKINSEGRRAINPRRIIRKVWHLFKIWRSGCHTQWEFTLPAHFSQFTVLLETSWKFFFEGKILIKWCLYLIQIYCKRESIMSIQGLIKPWFPKRWYFYLEIEKKNLSIRIKNSQNLHTNTKTTKGAG